MAARPLLAVDGDNLAHRAYHALPSSIKGGDGQPANMIVGFANMLIRAWEAEEPRTVFVAFDTLTVPTYRHELLPEYQSGRDFPRDLTDQLDRLPDLCGDHADAANERRRRRTVELHADDGTREAWTCS